MSAIQNPCAAAKSVYSITELADGTYGWHRVTASEADYLFAAAYEKRIAANNHGSNLLLSAPLAP